MADPTTHHATCYREHHECAVARLDRLRDTTRELVQKWSSPYGNSTDRAIGALMLRIFVGLRNITEGR